MMRIASETVYNCEHCAIGILSPMLHSVAPFAILSFITYSLQTTIEFVDAHFSIYEMFRIMRYFTNVEIYKLCAA